MLKIALSQEIWILIINQLNLEKDKNVIGIGFICYNPNELKSKEFDIYINKTINEFKKIYDIIKFSFFYINNYY